MCSLCCVYTLQRRLVASSQSLLYYNQILTLKAAKDSSIQFSSTVLYSNNLSTEEDVIFVLMLFFAFLKQKDQLK